MDPHLLRTFVSVARCGSFSDAAHELGFTPAAVSEHIASLEADLRTALLTRRPLMLTSAGARLLEHVGPLLLRLDAARADVERLSGSGTARLVAGAAPLAMTPRIATALDRVRQAHPAVRASLRILGRREIPAAVASGALDLGLIDGPAAPADTPPPLEAGPLIRVTVAESPLVVALPAGHPLARRLGLRLPDLADAPWLDAPDAAIPLGQLRAVSRTGGFRPSLTYEGTDVRGLLALTAAGHGLALLPHQAAKDTPGVVTVPLITPRLVHRTELLHGAALDGPARTLAAVVTGDRHRYG
ncbi:LysR family transcriptional regulator [Streptomyces hygroscopicus subsp. sporocinereus]|uniref:LysR family transcriptional regulator n=1 Tax=Streptomyces hygroscopicus TaxID=1912 RepID=A0ABQ3U967_STRHY|nr:LysR family transcriptional regulator [Streptomyces hygroscopicus]GHJ31951.1 LysR family transcriptional regulator [Streptomyces hygroscopicus]